MEIVTDFIFLGSKLTVDGDCSHEIKRRLLLGRKAMTNLVKAARPCLTLCDPRTTQSMESFRPEHWSG